MKLRQNDQSGFWGGFCSGLAFTLRSGVKHLEGEVFRNFFSYPGHRKSNIIVTNRRVFCVKEMDLLGHLTTDWECLFENFHRPPAVTGSELKIYCKEIHKLKLPKNQEPVRTLQLKDPNTAQKLHEAIWDAQDAQKQHHMVRQKSQRFLRLSKKQ